MARYLISAIVVGSVFVAGNFVEARTTHQGSVIRPAATIMQAHCMLPIMRVSIRRRPTQESRPLAS